MDLNTFLSENSDAIETWKKKIRINNFNPSTSDISIIRKASEYLPDVKKKLKDNAGCSSCMRNCAYSIISAYNSLSLNSTLLSPIAMNDIQNIDYYSINPAYRTNTVSIKSDGKIIMIVDKEGYTGDGQSSFHIKEVTEIISSAIKNTPGLERYFTAKYKEVISDPVVETTEEITIAKPTKKGSKSK